MHVSAEWGKIYWSRFAHGMSVTKQFDSFGADVFYCQLYCVHYPSLQTEACIFVMGSHCISVGFNNDSRRSLGSRHFEETELAAQIALNKEHCLQMR